MARALNISLQLKVQPQSIITPSDLVSSLGDAQACQGLLLLTEMANQMLVFAQPFSAITSTFLGELLPPKCLLKVLTPLRLIQFSQRQTGSNRHDDLVPPGFPASVFAHSKLFPALYSQRSMWSEMNTPGSFTGRGGVGKCVVESSSPPSSGSSSLCPSMSTTRYHPAPGPCGF